MDSYITIEPFLIILPTSSLDVISGLKSGVLSSFIGVGTVTIKILLFLISSIFEVRLQFLLKLLDSLELRLNRKSGSIKDWIVLIEGYQQINIEKKVNQNIEKVKSLFSLTESQIIELESYKR